MSVADALRVNAIRGSGHAYPGKLKCLPLPSGCEISRAARLSGSTPSGFPRVEGAMSQGGPSACARCRDPSGLTPSRFPKRTCAAMLSSTCEHHTPDDSISYPDMLSESLTTVSKPYYSPRSAALQWNEVSRSKVRVNCNLSVDPTFRLMRFPLDGELDFI
uniref:Uncharacterized protein n=1 Tax=Vitis vinifera TaxID=29760 RepID=A5AUX2_VITVI|nr:hypothetical protein VITISV_027528 [Vitis vinifera]